MKKFIVLPIVLTALIVSILAPSSKISADTSAAEPDDDWLHVEGTNIVDKYGNKVWLTGANWFGFNCRERMLLDSYHSNIIA
ncbi:MAG: endoglucanase, partial [Clostridiaceae bacterium]|nr:endoglucanase [Clostridiaceae bacterium]